MRKLRKFIFSVFRKKKKIIYDTGAFEFAKRFCVKGGRVDLYAWLLVICLLTIIHMVAICKKYPEGSLP